MSEETDAPQGGTEGETSSVEENSEATTEQQQGEAANTPTADDAGAAEDKPKKKAWWQDRIDTITAQKYEAQRDADYWRGKYEAKAESPKQEATEAVPTLEAHNYDERAYQEALYKHFERNAEGLVDRKLSERQQRQQQEALQTQFRDKLSEAAQQRPDLLQAISHLPVTEAVQDFVMHEPQAAEVLYQIGTDVDASQRFLSMSPYQQAMELGRRVGAPPAPKAARPIPPTPPQTVGGASTAVEKSPQEMSMAEYVAAAKKAGRI